MCGVSIDLDRVEVGLVDDLVFRFPLGALASFHCSSLKMIEPFSAVLVHGNRVSGKAQGPSYETEQIPTFDFCHCFLLFHIHTPPFKPSFLFFLRSWRPLSFIVQLAWLLTLF